jgi:N utilization substance protein B
MQMLFQEEQGVGSADEVEELFWRCHHAGEEAAAFATLIFRAAIARREEIDGMIRSATHRWKFERLASVDRSVLRTAVAEHLAAGTPAPVIIDEAVEIARKFGGEKSPEFVNGVLDRILTGEERSTV